MKRRTTIIICAAVFMLAIPIIAALIGEVFFKKHIINKPDYWYAYMAYFGTVCLAFVALYQSCKADEMNKRMLTNQLRQKIGYLRLGWQAEKDGFRYDDAELAQYNGKDAIWLHFINVGEDIIVDFVPNYCKLNGINVSVEAGIGVIFKEEGLFFPITLTTPDEQKACVELSIKLKNTASVEYCQEMRIELKNNGSLVHKAYRIQSFTSEISFL